MFDTTITLYSETITQDSYLNEVKTYRGRDIFAREARSVYRDEFYNASAAGLKPAAVLIIFFADYEGEKILKWNNTYYTITRAYRRSESDDLELTVEEHLGDIDGLEVTA